jgi:hypothetical protein
MQKEKLLYSVLIVEVLMDIQYRWDRLFYININRFNIGPFHKCLNFSILISNTWRYSWSNIDFSPQRYAVSPTLCFDSPYQRYRNSATLHINDSEAIEHWLLVFWKRGVDFSFRISPVFEAKIESFEQLYRGPMPNRFPTKIENPSHCCAS